MKTITFIHTVRHAKTAYGEQQRYAGWIDVPLNKRGIREAKEASKKMKDMKFDVVVTSTLRRCSDTARCLVGRKCPIIKNELCKERYYGAFQGLTYKEVKLIRPKVLFIKVGNDTHSVNPPGAEPFEDLKYRAKKFQRFIYKNYRGSSVLIVSHSAFLQQFHGLLRGLSCIEALTDYTSNLELTTFKMHGKRLLKEHSIKLIGEERFDF